jgi:predicted alpha/beta superfamily hydrolase
MSAMLHGCLADTEYLEVTAKSGHRYGVWVTVPPGYADSTDSYPLIYVTDGNFAVGQTAPLIVVQADPYLTIAPYIQVSVGYAADEAAEWAQLRNRDLVPAGEPVSDEIVAGLAAARDAGSMTQEQMDAFLAGIADTHADVFLDFLSDELHPRLQSQFRGSDAGHGLFGYSYGGLFSFYAWLRGGTPFATVGAGSPGLTGPNSVIFEMIRGLGDAGTGSELPRLHVTLNELEVLGDVPLYRNLARNVLAAVELLHAGGWSDKVSKELLHGTHVTGIPASFLSYLKACHAR